MEELPKCQANYVPLTPINLLPRAASVYAARTSVIYGSVTFTWNQTFERCRRLASSLQSLNVRKNDVVSVLAPNIPALYEMHFSVPMAGAVLNAINTRLDAKTIATILRHAESKLFFVDCQLVKLAKDAIRLLVVDDELAATPFRVPLVVVIDDLEQPTGARIGELEYEDLIRSGDPCFNPVQVQDEWDPIALNYTSGTTSAPKGVVYSHRGAYLSTMSLALQWEMRAQPVYLWTLPMFHCNGWTFTWGVAARGGTNVCIRNLTPDTVFRSIADHGVTHMCCAPVIFNMLLDEKIVGVGRKLNHKVEVLTGGAPPPAALLQKVEARGFHVNHAYGLTEATGPALVCEWQPEWNNLPSGAQARLKARQGVGSLSLADVDVKNLDTMETVPRDGKIMGEIVLRGSSIMKGYLKDPNATREAFKDGWFRTGDVGVIHPDGYIEIKDRSKDVIISGGENISSVEVESILYKHPAVYEAAVVAMPDQHWGERPCAFVALRPEYKREKIEEREIVAFCKKRLPGFMAPSKVVFIEEIPKTGTGKVQKFQLREMAKKYMNTVPIKKLPSFKKPMPRDTPRTRVDPQQQVLLARSRL